MKSINFNLIFGIIKAFTEKNKIIKVPIEQNTANENSHDNTKYNKKQYEKYLQMNDITISLSFDGKKPNIDFNTKKNLIKLSEIKNEATKLHKKEI